jgi:hypothetical protein
MKPSAIRRLRKRKALETAADELRDARGTDRDEIVAARRALWRAEKFHDRAVARAERDFALARAPTPLAAYGHRLLLYDDRLSTPTRTHELVRAVRADVTDAPMDDSGVQLVVEGPTWREVVEGPRHDEERLRGLAEEVESAAREAEAVKAVRRPDMKAAEGRLAGARLERLGIEEAKPLLDRLTELTEDGERVLDMAPGISTGHDGVLVVTDRRLLFVGLRHRLSLAYDGITAVAAGGKWFGARLIISTPTGKSVVSGLPARHAVEIAELARQQVGAESLGA